jgi:hypothetical protein
VFDIAAGILSTGHRHEAARPVARKLALLPIDVHETPSQPLVIVGQMRPRLGDSL